MSGYSHTPEGGGEPTVNSGKGSFNGSHTLRIAASRGTTIVEQYPRDNVDWMGFDEHEARVGKDMEGGPDNLRMIIKDGRVPME